MDTQILTQSLTLWGETSAYGTFDRPHARKARRALPHLTRLLGCLSLAPSEATNYNSPSDINALVLSAESLWRRLAQDGDYGLRRAAWCANDALTELTLVDGFVEMG